MPHWIEIKSDTGRIELLDADRLERVEYYWDKEEERGRITWYFPYHSHYLVFRDRERYEETKRILEQATIGADE